MSRTLSDLFDNLYRPLNLKIRSEGTTHQYGVAFRCFAQFLGHEPTTDDLTDDTVTLWMSRLLADGLAAVTVKERAGRIGAIWNWLARRRMVDKFPTFCKPDVPETMPTALSEGELRRLFESAAKERGKIEGIPGSLWWTSYLAFVFSTAERKTAALSVEIKWLDLPNGICTIPPAARKGGKKWACYKLWPEVVELLAAVIAAEPHRELVWPWNRCKGSYYTSYRRILRDASLPVDRRHLTHSLRCSHATWKAAGGGDATRALGHSDPATTQKFYLDPRFQPPDQHRLFIPWD